jgi:peroxiredoxin Q/BCP
LECKSFREDGKAIRRFDVVYFMASCDTAETNRKFAESLNLDFPLLSDANREVAEAYGVVTSERRVPFRWTFFISENGKILFIDKNVNPMTHGKDVADRLKILGIRALPEYIETVKPDSRKLLGE